MQRRGRRSPYELVGQRFGRWVVIERCHDPSVRGASWLCRCDCGTEGVVKSNTLMMGKSRSCGCARRNATATHMGLSKTRIYNAWRGMLARCEDPASNRYESYAGRGIKICAEWHDFERFVADMGEPPDETATVERIDNDGDYEPGNCCWARHKEQARNRRTSLLITYRGETRCLAEWAEMLRLPYKQTWKRLRVYGWTPERAFEHA